MSNGPRRVIAGLDAAGKSCVVSDTRLDFAGSPLGMEVANVWTGRLGPADNAAPLAAGLAPFRMEQLAEPVYAMMYVEYGPDLGRDDPHMHFTDTVDHFTVIEGEVVLVLESGDVVLKAGDIGICRGVMHGWRNDSGKPARLVTFVLPAAPPG
ncbi:MAG: cupin domain-containing protein [Novosphingobium sp.]|jgi:mannose-6-phosphate isomerase-like protein (cupin superfamily)|nr:cupin domain-containing protein [Novosphingobium sp.]